MFTLRKSSLLLSVVMVLASGCMTHRNINMLQVDLQKINEAQLTPPELTIQRGDLLFIGVSSKDQQSDLRYNLTNYYSGTNPAAITAASMLGYLIGASGTVRVGDLDEVKAEGLTTNQLARQLKDKLKQFLNEPDVTVRFLNFKVTVLGEVARPSSYQIPTEKVTIMEALGLAGDITVYGERNRVLVIREVGGQRKYGWIDLTKGDFFSSPYFFLQQNDVVYVYSNNRKFENTDQTTNKNVGLVTSILSSLAITITAINALTR